MTSVKFMGTANDFDLFFTAQYLQALGNFKHCLKIQQANLSPEIAETHFIIGLCCGFCGQYDESLLNYKSAVTLMESKIGKL